MDRHHGHSSLSSPAATAAPSSSTNAPDTGGTSITASVQTHDKKFNLQDFLEVAEIAAIIITSMFGSHIGRSIRRWAQAVRANKSIPTLPAPPAHDTTSVVPVTTHGPVEPYVMGSKSGGGGDSDDEVSNIMTMGETFRIQVMRTAQAEGTPLSAKEKKKLDQLVKTVDYIADPDILSQTERDFLGLVASRQPTAKLQVQFWQNLAAASTSKKAFTAYLRANRIIRDPSPVVTAFLDGVADGLDRAAKTRETEVARLRKEYKARIRRALKK